MNIDQKFMQRCIELAEMGLGQVAPNPLVGSVIVHENKIIGEGFHQQFGGAHAEVNAVNSVKNKELLKTSTLYVTLEPCSHFGKTPPCADLIVKMGILRVVISCEDPFPKVAGKGIEILKNAGVNVQVGVLKEEYEFVNRRFFTFFKKQRPYIILKWAQTKDGFIDVERNDDNPKITWITNESCRTLVHKWRSEEQAILIGTTTATNDNPELTVRSWVGKNPLRIVIDQNNCLPKNLKVFNDKAKTIIITEKFHESKSEKNLETVIIPFSEILVESILNELYNRNIHSVIIEGGAKTLNSFICKNIWDEARVFTGDVTFGKGLPAPILNKEPNTSEMILESKLEVYQNFDN